ncbi:tryptophan-rich sensory protein [Candidatus Kaiserbacteria bacterium]|nr:tryptophan-rich sensory protein [Candidatus Kaiserbacteria bacterium]
MAIMACCGAGLLGSLFIDSSFGSWYESLAKPFFTPPNWVFLPIWALLYGMMSAALAIMWLKDPHADEFSGWVPLFLVHLIANFGWVIFFFGFHAILIALIDSVILAFCIFMLICGALEVDKRVSWLLAPYLAWVLFALVLNAAIWFLN